MAIDVSKIEPSLENARKHFPAVHIGPLWATDDDGYFLLPEHTIGYDAIAWAETYLNAIKGEGRLQLTNEQRRFFLWFYSVDKTGRFVYRRAVWQAAKGTGKDPLLAVLSMVEFIGPSQFSHFDSNGEARGKRNVDAWTQLLAVSKDQNKNTMQILPGLISKELIQEHGLDIQRELIYAHGGRNRLEIVGTSSRSSEGNRVTFAGMNETAHWTPSAGGESLFKTIKGNLSKTRGRYLAITNAWIPGEDSVAEQIREGEERVWAGLAKPSGTLYCSIEAHPDAPMLEEWIPFVVDGVLGDADWQREDMASLVQDILDPSYGVLQSRKMFFNQVVTGEDAFFSKAEWDGALAEGMLGSEEDLRPKDEIVLGFDGSRTDDATALVAIRVRDKLIVPLLIEQKPFGPAGEHWRVDEALVDEAVKRTFATYEVRAFYADRQFWESYIDAWSEEYGEQLEVSYGNDSKVSFDMRGSKQRVSKYWEAYVSAIVDGRLKHNGNKILRTHALNARRGHNGVGLVARKEKKDSPNKIDAMVASYAAYAALTDLLEKGNRGRKRHKPGRIIRGGY